MLSCQLLTSISCLISLISAFRDVKNLLQLIIYIYIYIYFVFVFVFVFPISVLSFKEILYISRWLPGNPCKIYYYYYYYRSAVADNFCRWFGRVASPPRTYAITGYYVVTMGTHSRRRSTRNRLFLAIGRGLTLPTSTVRLKMFSSIQSTIDSLVYRWWQRDFWTEHFWGLGPTDYKALHFHFTFTYLFI